MKSTEERIKNVLSITQMELESIVFAFTIKTLEEVSTQEIPLYIKEYVSNQVNEKIMIIYKESKKFNFGKINDVFKDLNFREQINKELKNLDINVQENKIDNRTALDDLFEIMKKLYSN